MLRTALAFFASPFAAALLQALVVAVWPAGFGPDLHPASTFVFICVLVWILEAVLGTAAVLWMRRRKLASLRAYALAGACVVGAPLILVLAWSAARGRAGLGAILIGGAWFALLGALSGSTFWWIARPRRPQDFGEVFR